MSLTEEQLELAATMCAVLTRRADSAAVRAAMESPSGYDADLWQTLCEQIGVAALPIPEEYGGAGATLVESCLVLEELGASLAPSPMLSNLITGQALLAAPAGEERTDLLARVAAGEVASLLSINRLIDTDQGTTSGGAALVLDGDRATILLAEVENRLVLVDPATVRRTPVPTLDQGTRLAEVDLTGAAVTELGGADALDRAWQVGCVGAAAMQAGATRRGLEMTVAYGKERVQFGRPIGSFQALKHRMADMLVLVEMSRSAYLAAAEALSTGAADAAEKASIAKAYCGDALSRVASETVQLHGGIGVTWEHDAQLVFKRAHALNQVFGQPHQHRAVLPL